MITMVSQATPPFQGAGTQRPEFFRDLISYMRAQHKQQQTNFAR